MERRDFLRTAAGAAIAARSVLGANDRVQMGIIGTGNRGSQVYESFMRNNDVTFVAACDVAKTKLDQFATKAGGKMTTTGDYRRILDNKDIDAVLITTPDHWHSPILAAACQAGKDVYVEKPVSNTIEAAQKMVAAVKQSNRIVQVGLQQRSWPHFQECAKMVRDGLIGRVNHCVMLFPGFSFPSPPDKPEPVPADLDWEGFQGPAKRVPYTSSRQRSWRSYYDYGGGSITDWGVHLSDIMNMYLDADNKTPLLTSASGQYISIQPPDPEKAPDTFSVTWKFDRFVGTFMNAVVPSKDPSLFMSDMYGNYFYGERGVLLVNRYGYEIMPNAPLPNFPGMPQRPKAEPIQARRVMDMNGINEAPDTPFGSATVRHTRNFLDCVKSRRKPICDIELGFNSTLPCLLAVLAVRQNRAFTWDGTAARPV